MNIKEKSAHWEARAREWKCYAENLEGKLKEAHGKLAYYSIEDKLGCEKCVFHLNKKYLNAAAVGKILRGQRNGN